MGAEKAVVVYAASGYTGRLVCDALTRLRVPFVAAGRSQQRLQDVADEMRGRGADCEVATCDHTPSGLRTLLSGKQVVLNTSGPFSLLGHAVVDAALDCGVHYFDTTGEQDFMLEVRRDFSARYANKKLVLAPSAAFLWAPGTAAAEVCLETAGVHTLRVAYAPPSLQTVASLQSMLRSCRRPGYDIVDGQLALQHAAEVRELPVPGFPNPKKGVLIGAGEATFFLDDARVRSCQTWFVNDTLARVAPSFALWNRLSAFVSGDKLDRISDALVLKLKKDPPAEDPATQRFVVVAEGQGSGQRSKVVLDGNSPYITTGFLCAMSAQSVLDGKARRFGYGSLADAFGARYVLQRLEEVGCKSLIESPGAERTSGTVHAAAQA